MPLRLIALRSSILKSFQPSTDTFSSRSPADTFLESMTIHMLRMPAYSEPLFPHANAAMADGAGVAAALYPLLGLTGLCLISLLILGGLWVRRRRGTHGFRQRAPEGFPPQVAAYDHVTGLPTRRLCETLLEQAVGRAARTGRALALLVIELEHFRMVEEGQGQTHSHVLVRVQAARLKGVLRSTETVARLAQDQFAMILDNLASHQEVMAIVEKLQATAGLPLTLDGHELFLTCRIGVAFYPQDATDHKQLIEQAIRAVKIAKSDGQTVRFTSPISSPAFPQAMPVASEQAA
jgi:diguanylate cyclase (GGDEF)-like protein